MFYLPIPRMACHRVAITDGGRKFGSLLGLDRIDRDRGFISFVATGRLIVVYARKDRCFRNKRKCFSRFGAGFVPIFLICNRRAALSRGR